MRFVAIMVLCPMLLVSVSTFADALRPIGALGALWFLVSIPVLLVYGIVRLVSRARRDASEFRPHVRRGEHG